MNLRRRRGQLRRTIRKNGRHLLFHPIRLPLCLAYHPFGGAADECGGGDGNVGSIMPNGTAALV